MDKITEGWGFPFNSKKWHYFRETRSLCKRWMFFGALEPNSDKADPNDCKSCRKLVDESVSR